MIRKAGPDENFDAAFKIGFRQGEQIALDPDDIDWERGLLHIKRAITHHENPLWTARAMGHRDTAMIIQLYGKHIENLIGTQDGNSLNEFYEGKKSR
jgi:hypothetical protein